MCYQRTRSAEGADSATAGTKVYVVVPLLREQARLESFLQLARNILQALPQVSFLLVTTEKEHIEDPGAEIPTDRLVQELIAYSGVSDRIRHIHYPHDNRIKAKQVNFGIAELARTQGSQFESSVVAVYDVDGRHSLEAFRACASLAARGHVVQQSSFFLANFNRLLWSGRILPAADAVYQSRWTLQHELPRLLIPTVRPGRAWQRLTRYCFANCVAHGLFLPAMILKELGGMPEPRVGLEDSELGFLLRTRGVPIRTCPYLEDSDAAETFQVLYRQKRGWVLGPLGVFEYRMMALTLWPHSSRLGLAWLVFQGLWNGLKWALAGPYMVAFMILAAIAGIPYIILVTALYLLYCYGPYFAVFFVIKRTQSGCFQRIGLGSIALCALPYVLMPIVNSIFGISGLYLWLWLLGSRSMFAQRKTEVL